jgi:hypothetical protein
MISIIVCLFVVHFIFFSKGDTTLLEDCMSDKLGSTESILRNICGR